MVDSIEGVEKTCCCCCCCCGCGVEWAGGRVGLWMDGWMGDTESNGEDMVGLCTTPVIRYQKTTRIGAELHRGLHVPHHRVWKFSYDEFCRVPA